MNTSSSKNSLTNEESIKRVKEYNNYWKLDPEITVVDGIQSDSLKLQTSVALAEDKFIKPRKQKKYQDLFDKHVMAIACNLCHAYFNDPSRYVSFSRDRTFYTFDKTKKGFQFSYRYVRIITDSLIKFGYVDFVPGHNKSPQYPQGHLSRMRAIRKIHRNYQT